MGMERSLKGLYMKKRGMEVKYPIASFNVPPFLDHLLRDRKETLVLVGSPGTGKTKFLITYLKEVLNQEPLVINNIDGLRFYNGEPVVVFDDVE
jgi:type IV secretory pathway ATPase VirB11/archaellum biosynthesis ATPase